MVNGLYPERCCILAILKSSTTNEKQEFQRNIRSRYYRLLAPKILIYAQQMSLSLMNGIRETKLLYCVGLEHLSRDQRGHFLEKNIKFFIKFGKYMNDFHRQPCYRYMGSSGFNLQHHTRLRNTLVSHSNQFFHFWLCIYMLKLNLGCFRNIWQFSRFFSILTHRDWSRLNASTFFSFKLIKVRRNIRIKKIQVYQH